MKKMNPYKVLKKPIVFTEKLTLWRENGQNKVMFEVDKDATKHAIKEAVEQIFDVKVTKVNTMIVRGKMRRVGRGYYKRPNKKKAIVTLAEGHEIDEYFGGV